jgi:MoxR-like ATPase
MKKFRDFNSADEVSVNEVVVKGIFKRKNTGLNINSKNLVKFFHSIAGKEFRSFRDPEFHNVFNDYFKLDPRIKTFYKDEVAYFFKHFATKIHNKKISINVIPSKVDDNVKVKVSQLSKGKVKKLKIPSAIKGDKIEKFAKTVLKNMMGTSKGRLLLTGDPGTGKTSSVQTVMSLLRMNVITIEAPHVSEEHIINVPYLVKRGVADTKHESSFEEIGSSFEVVNADSNLITTLRKAKPIKDVEYEKFLKANRALAPLAAQLKNVIASLNYTNVLFIDEFFRSGSTRIQNLFRTILNGKIGTTAIPANTYIIYSSNMDDSDGSLDGIALNQQFQEVEFDKPEAAGFMTYMADKFTNIDPITGEEIGDKQDPITPEVYNAFIDALKDEEMGVKDKSTEAEIRVSPRRWEEIIKYVNANIPASSNIAANRLLTYIRDNMKDYETGELSSLYPKYADLVKKLITDSSDINAEDIVVIEDEDWRDNLSGQIESKLKMGNDRKYVPIISGKPGLGKTTIIDNICETYSLKKIDIDCSVLNSEDVIGLTTPSTNGGVTTTEFTTPPLHAQIMADYDESIEPVNGYKYTHILFLDEITRVATPSVFNGIRALILDKKVGQVEIPKDIMIVGAMNPVDVGAETLTDHMKDVVDIVTAEANYIKLFQYFKSVTVYKNNKDTIGFDISPVVSEVFDGIVDTFKSDVDPDGNTLNVNDGHFYWTDGFNVVYVSPREFDDMMIGSIENVVSALIIDGYDSDVNYSDVESDEYINVIIDAVKETMVGAFKFIISKHNLVDTEFMSKFDLYIQTTLSSQYTVIEELMNSIQSEAIVSMRGIFNDSESIEELLNYDGVKDILETIIDTNDVDIIINEISDVLIEKSQTNDIAVIFDNLLDIRKLLMKVDWSKYSGEITNGLSNKFIEMILKPLMNKILKNDGMYNDIPFIDYMTNIYTRYDELISMIDMAKENKNNMFI